MKTKVMLMVAMLALSAPVFAAPGGEPNNTNCNGVGNPNSPCVPGGGGGNPPPGPGGNGGNGGHGGDATAVAGAIGVGVGIANAQSSSAALASASNHTEVDVRNTNLNSQLQGQLQGQSQTNNASVGNVSSGDVTSTNTNSNTANGGAGGQAVSAAVVESGAASAVVESGAVQYTYTERLQAPSIGQGSFAISGCSVAGNAGGSGPGWSGFLGFGFTPAQCYDFMLAQAYQAIGEKKAVCDILKNSKAGKRQEKRGIVLPECTPEVQNVVVPVPVPADLSLYATKEELNRAFKASQTK